MGVSAADVIAFFERFLATIEREQARLDRLDAVAGDGDHGATMVIGLRAVVGALPADSDAAPAELLRVAARRFASVGGSTGPLWGTAILSAAQSLDGNPSPDLRAMAAAVAAASDGVARRGECSEGDKTMLDVMAPVARALGEAADADLETTQAVSAAQEAAAAGLARTLHLSPRRGRAERAADRSRGHADAGASSVLLAVDVVAELVAAKR